MTKVGMEKPIIFSGPMVRAILEGRKTMTRRIIKLPTKGMYEHPQMGGWEATTVGGGGCFTIAKDGSKRAVPEQVAIWHRTRGTCIAMSYQPGMRLWVRESCHRGLPGGLHYYSADGSRVNGGSLPDKPSIVSIFMPRWASRIALEVTAVKVERLQDISEEDAKAEGAPFACELCGNDLDSEEGAEVHAACDDPDTEHGSHKEGFRRLWDSINLARAPWNANPWVVAVTFDRDPP
jgi:hypothetical protein